MDVLADGGSMLRVGAGAGLLTSLFWVLTSLFFAAAGRRIAVTWVNTIRIVLAVLLLGGTHLAVFGTVLPQFAEPSQIVMLALSGFIGLSLCDQALFVAFVDIGPRRALLCMTTSPIFAVVFGSVLLGEQLGWVSLAGILVTVLAVGFVVFEKADADTPANPHMKRGVILAMFAALSQAAGGLFSKVGMGAVGLGEWVPAVATEDQIPPLAATLVRMVFGLFGMAPIVLIYVVLARSKSAKPRHRTNWPAGLGFTALGALVGPFLGVWMSLVAFRHAPLGIAQTMVSLSPVLILPFTHYLLKERVSPRAVLGAVVAVGGAAVLPFASEIENAFR